MRHTSQLKAGGALNRDMPQAVLGRVLLLYVAQMELYPFYFLSLRDFLGGLAGIPLLRLPPEAVFFLAMIKTVYAVSNLYHALTSKQGHDFVTPLISL